MGLAGPAAPAHATEITDDLALWYELDATSGTVAVDSSDHGRNGTVNGTAGWSGNGQGLTFNGYLFTTGNSFRTAIASGNSSTEQNTRTAAALQRSVWKHVTYTQTGTTGVLYEDGVEKARNTSVTLTPVPPGPASARPTTPG
ncbi:hypothetical protein [Streptomyces sp. NPDC057740]|uniref:hypothetical protein n=1 Tax=Streptomyces sp. NPDC057740 TaxID=3346234 RepID=UPI0036B7B970